ncbi:hypothetical protein QWY28_14645 [Nocardioides sp. SOB77]|uniref:Uncharacterized protein n=1 Tax=Nocardioides oceani TaxID=3058369 RepID=A0ABT8FHN1_9ACTN|nr:hypothetical protein [Nocardioides oceani]MDN4174199.1 hypothetical protein [Nocardioides oceani]
MLGTAERVAGAAGAAGAAGTKVLATSGLPDLPTTRARDEGGGNTRDEEVR